MNNTIPNIPAILFFLILIIFSSTSASAQMGLSYAETMAVYFLIQFLFYYSIVYLLFFFSTKFLKAYKIIGFINTTTFILYVLFWIFMGSIWTENKKLFYDLIDSPFDIFKLLYLFFVFCFAINLYSLIKVRKKDKKEK